jgi:hypothetical protein
VLHFVFESRVLINLLNSPRAQTGALEVDRIEVTGIKDPDAMPYSKAFDAIKKFKKIGPLRYASLKFFFKTDDASFDFRALKLHLSSDSMALSIPIGSDGVFEMPFSEKAMTENGELYLNQKPGKMKGFYGPFINIPESSTFTYRELMDGVTESTKIMKKMYGFFFPSFLGASLRYSKLESQSLEIRSSRGTERIVIGAERKSISLDFDRSLYEENPSVWISHKPIRIVPFNVAQPKANDN